MKKRWVIVIVTVVVLAFAWSVDRGAIWRGRDAYYRGVYDACVRARTLDEKVTLFDLVSCDEIVQHARQENWFDVRMPEPLK